jgi:hypothetical protein
VFVNFDGSHIIASVRIMNQHHTVTTVEHRSLLWTDLGVKTDLIAFHSRDRLMYSRAHAKGRVRAVQNQVASTGQSDYDTQSIQNSPPISSHVASAGG